jgi:hypothetical protein
MSHDHDDSDAVWAAFEAAGEHKHEMDDESEGKTLLLQSKAVSTLAAMAGGQTSMVMAQLDELWTLSCMEKVFCMATWIQVAGQAAHAVGANLALVAGTPDVKPKTDPSRTRSNRPSMPCTTTCTRRQTAKRAPSSSTCSARRRMPLGRAWRRPTATMLWA